MDTTSTSGASNALRMVRVLRAVILVLCLVTGTIAWLNASHTVWALALVIAVEETWETSVVAAALRRQTQAAPREPHRS